MTAIDSLIRRIDRPIALVGMMGSGKSMLGRRLAKATRLPYADTDHLVEEMAGLSIADIFDLAGEGKFRELEQRAISDVLSDGPAIISTGGGAICNPDTAAILIEKSVVVWLRATPANLLERIGSTQSRPLLAGDDPLGVLNRLTAEREQYYAQAHIHLTTDGMSTTAAFDALLHILDRNLPVKQGHA